MGTYKIKLVDFPVITLMNSDGSEVDDLPVTDPDNGLAGFKGIYIQAETAADTWRGFRVKSSGANTLLLDESDFSGELKAGQKVEGLIDLASLNTNDNALMLSDSKLADSVDISAMDSRITRVTSGSQTLAFYAVTANYNHSREMCQYLFGGDLVSIHDQARHDLFSPNTGSNTTWHIGLNDSGSDGTFTWIDGSILDYNEPMGFNNTLEKDCVFYQKSTNNWQINYCTDRRYFVCAY